MDGNGSCLFASIRHQLAVPQEYTNAHLRREVVHHLAMHVQEYGPDLIPLVRAIYGSGDPNTYPQSICSYFQDLLTQHFWADEIVLKALSILFNLTITVLRAENGVEIRVRHRRPISEVDVVLILSQSGHYSPAGQYLLSNIVFLYSLGSQVLKH